MPSRCRDQDRVRLSGVLLGPGTWTRLVLESWATALPSLVAFTAFGLLMSVVTRNGPAGVGLPVVVGLLTQLGAMAGMPPILQVLLPAARLWRRDMRAPCHR